MRHVGKSKSSLKFKFITTSDPEYEAERMLRWEILRKPLGMPPGSELMPEDPSSLHLVALEKKTVIGCILFHPENGNGGRVFQMALSEEYQGRGFGRKLLHTMEDFLSKKGYLHIYSYVREEAAGFYQSVGFIKEGEPIVFNGIPHHMMKKVLIPVKEAV